MLRPKSSAGGGGGGGASLRPAAQSQPKLRSSSKRSSSWLPSTQGVVWILFVVILVISCSLLGAAVYIVTSSADGGAAGEKSKAFRSSQVLEPPKQQPPRKSMGLDAQSARRHFVETSRTVLDGLRQDFATRYGSYADQIRTKGVQRYAGAFNATARGILQAAASSSSPRIYRMAFGGYSVTVGRGNFYHQSYPKVLETILQPAFEQLFQLQLQVHNAAIGGIPSFPYGFCLSHFWGGDDSTSHPAVVSWDYSMNERAKDPTVVLESYVRHAQQTYSNPQNTLSGPLIVALDKHAGRCQLLQHYVEQGLLPGGALCVGKADAIFTKAQLKALEEAEGSEKFPPGLQQWNEFGAPPQCPGRSSWHPKRQEHELIAWILALEWIDALEQAVTIADTDPEWMQKYAISHGNTVTQQQHRAFPKPESRPIVNTPAEHDAAIQSLLFGHAVTDHEYQMHHVSCRTNFLPATDTDKLLSNSVVSGLAKTAADSDIMKERTDEDYANGWVLDVSQVERDTKIKVEKCGGLGYQDMKIALYGIPQSGPLKLWLPVSSHVHTHRHGHHDHAHADDYLLASHWLDSLVLCEANEKRKKEACQLHQDLDLTVGGVKVSSSSIVQMQGAGEYLKRPTCVYVPLPDAARMTSFGQLAVKDNAATKQRLLSQVRGGGDDRPNKNNDDDDDHLGLVVEVQAAERVTRQQGACCLSHVVWELH